METAMRHDAWGFESPLALAMAARLARPTVPTGRRSPRARRKNAPALRGLGVRRCHRGGKGSGPPRSVA
eukprot:2621900-Lingulodinium_polyedra.AAC.1